MEKEVEAIVKIAKEIMTRYGSHVPMLFIIGEKGKVNTAFPDFGPNHEDKIRQMANMGVNIAGKHNVGQLKYLIFVVEAWMSIPKGGKITVQPSQDPKRKEVLIVTTLDVSQDKQEVVIYQMIRDKWGRLIELNRRPFSDEITVESPLLPAFIAGYNLIKR